MKNQKNISLVLGSGGARGLAHIGVIKCLEEYDYKICSISGCSIGALIGGIFAAGKLDEFEKWVLAITRKDIITLTDLTWEKSGFVKGDKIINTLINLVGEINIEELPMPFTAVATDVVNEKEVWLSSGRLFDAIRASISLPFLFTAFNQNGVSLVDGGVLNPVPIAPTFRDDTDLTIAVNLGGKITPHQEQNPPQTAKTPPHLHKKIAYFISNIQKSVTKKVMGDGGAFDIANQAFDAMQSALARQKLAAYPPDIVIELPRNTCGMLEFYRASEIINLGYQKTKSILKDL